MSSDFELQGRSFTLDAPEIKCMLEIMASVQRAQHASGDYGVDFVASLLYNTFGHLLASSSISEAAIDDLARTMRKGLPALVIQLRKNGGSPLVREDKNVPAGRA